MISSLRVRMMIAVGLLAIASVVAVALAARQRTRSEFRHFQELIKTSDSPNADAKRISALLGARCCGADSLDAAAAALSPHQVLVVAGASGDVIAKLGKPLDRVAQFRFSRTSNGIAIETTPHDRRSAATGVRLRFDIAGYPVKMANGNSAYLYVFPWLESVPERPEDVFLGSVDRSLLMATTLIAALGLLATWMLTRRIAGPIEELRGAAQDLARGNLARRVDTHGSDEIADLSRSFNAMAAALEGQQVLRRNLVQDVVHELRTPLTALRCHLDSITDGVSTDPQKEFAGANEEIDQLARLVGDLHELALAEARELKLTIADAPLEPIIESAARAAGLTDDPRLRMTIDNRLTIRGDLVRLRQVVLNLLSNAARHTPAEGMITVTAFHRNRETAVEVHNTGSRLSSYEMAHVFDRFYRADASRQRATGGTGLGLAIVKNLVEAQGGRVWSQSDDSGVSFGFALLRQG